MVIFESIKIASDIMPSLLYFQKYITISSVYDLDLKKKLRR